VSLAVIVGVLTATALLSPRVARTTAEQATH
jgi:hypothetical protein